MLTLGNKNDVAPRGYDGAGVRGVQKRVLIGPAVGAPHFVLRHFTVDAEGCSPYHTHPWEHEVYVLAGRGTARFSGGSRPIGPGDFVYVPPLDEHQFANAGSEPFEFLCVVPLEGDDG